MQPMKPRPFDWTVRAFDASRDTDAVLHIDTTYSTDEVHAPRRHGDALILEPARVTPPQRRHFPLDLAADAWTHGSVALLDGRVCGFIAWALENWNRRMSIWHFYVDLPYRRMGAGRVLLDSALDWARRAGARCAWAETSGANQPGIAAYRRLGFDICGFDSTLYFGTSTENDIAVFLARTIDPTPASPPHS